MEATEVGNASSLRYAQEGAPTARRLLTAAMLLGALLASGCSSLSRSTVDSFRLLGNSASSATPEQVSKNRFPQAQLKAPGLDAVIVLGYVDDGRQSWYAGQHAIFWMDANGLVGGMTGLGRRIESRIVGRSPFDDLTAVQGTIKFQRTYDIIPGYQFGHEATSTLTRGPEVNLDILGRTMRLIQFDERVRGTGFDLKNTYWVDAISGFIWKSRQYLAPDYPVEVTQLKPYRPAKD